MDGIDLKRLAGLAAVFVIVTFAWSTPVVYPVKVLVVLFHEMSHGLAAVLTGGEIDRIELSANLGGVCYTRGGWRLAILPAGYLGSMAWGAALLIAACRTKLDRYASQALGVVLLGTTLVFVRSTFGFASGMIFGAGLLYAGRKLSSDVNDVILSFVGLTSMLYAVIDIKEDLISRTVPASDAYRFSEIIPLPAIVWGSLWGLASLVMLAVVLRFCFAKPPATAFSRA